MSGGPCVCVVRRGAPRALIWSRATEERGARRAKIKKRGNAVHSSANSPRCVCVCLKPAIPHEVAGARRQLLSTGGMNDGRSRGDDTKKSHVVCEQVHRRNEGGSHLSESATGLGTKMSSLQLRRSPTISMEPGVVVCEVHANGRMHLAMRVARAHSWREGSKQHGASIKRWRTWYAADPSMTEGRCAHSRDTSHSADQCKRCDVLNVASDTDVLCRKVCRWTSNRRIKRCALHHEGKHL
jgi:hypothetical protein